MIALLLSPIGRLGLIVSGVAAFLAVFAYEQRNIGASRIIAASQEEARKINATNEQVHIDAAKPGSADRVLRKYCRDCTERRAVP